MDGDKIIKNGMVFGKNSCKPDLEETFKYIMKTLYNLQTKVNKLEERLDNKTKKAR